MSTSSYQQARERLLTMAGPTAHVRVLVQTGDRWPVEVGTVTVTDRGNHDQQVAEALRALADEIAPHS